jgi:hypothetical protein
MRGTQLLSRNNIYAGKKICNENITFYKNAGTCNVGKLYTGNVLAAKDPAPCE